MTPTLDLAEIFNTFAKKAIADFPTLGGALAIHDANTDTLHGQFKDTDKESLLQMAREVAPEGRKKGFTAHATRPLSPDKGAPFIGYLADPQKETLSSLLETLRHELGHIIVPRGLAAGSHSETFREGVADAFSLLYQQEDPGQQRRAIEDFLKEGSSRLLQYKPDSVHVTFPIGLALQDLAAMHDISGMSPQQAANTAYRLALLHAPEQEDAEKLLEIFESFRKIWGGIFTGPYTEEGAAIMLADHGKHSRTILEAGKRAFSMSQLNDPANKGLLDYKPAEFWDDLRRRIAEKEASFQRAAETPEERYAHEARDMMVLGRFDKDADGIIDPDKYESRENRVYLDLAMKIYTLLRLSPDTKFTQDEAVARARMLAEKAPALRPADATQRPKTQAVP